MGSGLAKALSQKFEGLELGYQIYINDCLEHNHSLCSTMTSVEAKIASLLGRYYLHKVNEDLYVANVFGQGGYSRMYQMTDYSAVNRSLDILKYDPLVKKNIDKVYFPYKMGCGLGGGEWKIYLPIIQRHFPDAIICYP